MIEIFANTATCSPSCHYEGFHHLFWQISSPDLLFHLKVMDRPHGIGLPVFLSNEHKVVILHEPLEVVILQDPLEDDILHEPLGVVILHEPLGAVILHAPLHELILHNAFPKPLPSFILYPDGYLPWIFRTLDSSKARAHHEEVSPCAPLHHYTNTATPPPLHHHHYTTTPLHHYTTTPLQPPPLHHYTTTQLHHYTTTPLHQHCYTTTASPPLLHHHHHHHCTITTSHHHTTTTPPPLHHHHYTTTATPLQLPAQSLQEDARHSNHSNTAEASSYSCPLRGAESSCDNMRLCVKCQGCERIFLCNGCPYVAFVLLLCAGVIAPDSWEEAASGGPASKVASVLLGTKYACVKVAMNGKNHRITSSKKKCVGHVFAIFHRRD